MKKFGFRLASFLAFLPLGWSGLFLAAYFSPGVETRFISKQNDWGYVNAKTAEWTVLAEDRAIDILFFGSSTCYSGINPHVFIQQGVEAFNFCSSSQTAMHSAFFLESALTTQSPSLVVLDVYPALWDRENIAEEPVRDWITNSNLWSPHWIKAYTKMAIHSRSPYSLMIGCYYGLIRNFQVAGPRAVPDPNGLYKGRGFVYRTFDPLVTMPDDEAELVHMSHRTCEAISRISDLCEARGISLVLLNPPQLVEEKFNIPDCIRSLPWIDGNDWPEAKHPSNYYDDHHLSGAGAQRYSAWLVQTLWAE